MRVGVTLACTDCKQRNYQTTKDKKKNTEKMEVRKYCKFCNAHTIHKEIK
ncbi:MAG TPA: 50S ribosomal protein L33 [Syntrophomonas sp.]|nr:50S ribosomal protein L33 [Syntrophomonas sp.]